MPGHRCRFERTKVAGGNKIEKISRQEAHYRSQKINKCGKGTLRYEKNECLDHRIGGNDDGITMACCDFCQGRWRNGGLFPSVFRGESGLCHLRRSMCRQGDQKILDLAGHHSRILFGRDMAVLRYRGEGIYPVCAGLLAIAMLISALIGKKD